MINAENIANTIRFIRELSRDDLRSYAQGYADDMLGRYGYERRGGFVLRALPIAGAFGVGLAIGTGVGLLIAPASGKDTREQITNRVNDVIAKVRSRAHGTNGKSETSVEDARA